jgi:hypothetical protein
MMAFNKDYCTKLSEVKNILDENISKFKLSNDDNSTRTLTMKDCLKYLFSAEYSKCVKNVTQGALLL